jgi:hypothetical protein
LCPPVWAITNGHPQGGAPTSSKIKLLFLGTLAALALGRLGVIAPFFDFDEKTFFLALLLKDSHGLEDFNLNHNETPPLP